MREIYLSKTFDILKKLFYIHLVFLVFMTLFRVVFFNYYLELDSFDNYYFDAYQNALNLVLFCFSHNLALFLVYFGSELLGSLISLEYSCLNFGVFNS